MREAPRKRLPKKSSKGIIVKELPDEVLVYDLDRDRAHCLNHSAAAIWERCDGHTTAVEIARAVQEKTGSQVGEEIVWLALEALGRGRLLEERVVWPIAIPRISRREAVRRIGIGATIAIPLVTSIIAPTPAQAATCKSPGQVCSTPANCCSSFCQHGTPRTCV